MLQPSIKRCGNGQQGGKELLELFANLNPRQLFAFFLREEAEDSVGALSSRVEVLTRRKEKLEAALVQVQIDR